MFTTRGLSWLADWIAEELDGASLFVGDGDQNSATKEIETIEVSEIEEDGSPVYTVRCSTTFNGDEANFDWKVRGVVLPDNTDIDREEQDLGRKAEGAVTELEVVLAVGR